VQLVVGVDEFILLVVSFLTDVLSWHYVPSEYAGNRTSKALSTGDVHKECGSGQERRPVPQRSDLPTLTGEGQEPSTAAAERHPR
jgi:hypothetical protein